MDEEQSRAFGAFLRQARHETGMSALELSRLTDIDNTTILRWEKGLVASPAPDMLAKVAEALDLHIADVFELAGYSNAARKLPSLPLYLRTRYDLPPQAMEQIERFATKIARKHGIDVQGPAPGEDEAA